MSNSKSSEILKIISKTFLESVRIALNFDDVSTIQNGVIEANFKILVQNPYKLRFLKISIPQEAKCFNIPILYTANTHFITPRKTLDLFLSSHLLRRTNPTNYCDATLHLLIVHLILFKCSAFFKFNMLDKKICSD